MTIRILPLVLSLIVSADGGVEATFTTNLGEITADLDFVGAPETVANFVTLAEGSRKWVDSKNGTVHASPFYDGMGFYSVVNETGDARLETGSKDGSGTDDPGYYFRDELSAPLAHSPYILAMSNSGPNTNGSRFYFTGDVSMPDRDGINVVFGSVTDEASRGVIDAILLADPGTVTISDVVITRTDLLPNEIEDRAGSLPAVDVLKPDFRRGEIAEVIHTQSGGTEVRADRSLNLVEWNPHYRNFLPDGDAGGTFVVDQAVLPAAFYCLSEISYGPSPGLAGFANKVLETETPGAGKIVYTFDSTGEGGTYQNIIDDPVFGEFVFFEGSFVVNDGYPAWYGPYSFGVYLYLFDEPLGGSPYNLVLGGYDSEEGGVISGRQESHLFSPEETPVMSARGSLIVR